jgi:benzoylsuccinyl-CoA thiolase BbsB subunit
MTEVFVAGAAMLPMGKYPGSSYGGLAVPPLLNACKSADIGLKEIEAVYCGNTFGGMLAGQRILREVGLGGIPVVNVENACSGGASAMNAAVRAIQAGEQDIIAVIGVDKLTQFGGGTLPLVSEDPEVRRGMVMPALYAMRARRHMYERGTTLEDLASISVKARGNAVRNPFAQLRKETSIEEVLASRPVADPLTLFQCCPTGDGAAAVILMSQKVVRKHAGPAIRVRASALHSGQVTSGFRDMLRPEITFHCARDAYEMAGCGPQDLDMVELHDAFTIAELIYYEALLLCEAGGATALLRSGETKMGGRVVVNPSGGLLSKGHPVGASGVAQIVEAFWQLTGQAEGRQIDGATIALTHVTGGGIAGLDHGACTIHIFEKV